MAAGADGNTIVAEFKAGVPQEIGDITERIEIEGLRRWNEAR